MQVVGTMQVGGHHASWGAPCKLGGTMQVGGHHTSYTIEHREAYIRSLLINRRHKVLNISGIVQYENLISIIHLV